MPTLLLIRHGQGSFGGATYDVLSELGERQSAVAHAALSAKLDGAPVLVSGDLRRQRDTAVPWVEGSDELTIDPRWNEYGTNEVLSRHAGVDASLEDPSASGTLTSRGFQEILDPALERWIAARDTTPGGWLDFRAGAVAALHDLAGGLVSGQTGIAFSSGGTIAACAVALLDAPDQVFLPLNRTAVNTGVTKILVGRRGLSLVSYNEHGHLAPGDITFR